LTLEYKQNSTPFILKYLSTLTFTQTLTIYFIKKD
jgi:hypothetical protein